MLMKIFYPCFVTSAHTHIPSFLVMQITYPQKQIKTAEYKVRTLKKAKSVLADLSHPLSNGFHLATYTFGQDAGPIDLRTHLSVLPLAF